MFRMRTLASLALFHTLYVNSASGNVDKLDIDPRSSIDITDVHEFDARLQDTGESIVELSTSDYYQYVDTTERDFDVVILFSSTDRKFHCDLCPAQLKEYERLAGIYRSNLKRHGYNRKARRSHSIEHSLKQIEEDDGVDGDDDGDEDYIEESEAREYTLHQRSTPDTQNANITFDEGSHIQFLWMDIKTSSKAFTSLGIKQLGTIAIFPAFREQSFADHGTIGVIGITAQSISKWLIQKMGHAQTLAVPPTTSDWIVAKLQDYYPYIKAYAYIIGFGFLLFWITQHMDLRALRRRWNSKKSELTSLCMWAVCLACVVFTSGYMWCNIRGMGAMQVTAEGRVSLIIGSMRGQTLTEAFIIGMLNSGVAFLTVALLSAPKHDPNFVGPIGSRIVFLLFILLLTLSFEIFLYRRTKNSGYPLRMLL